MRSTVVSPVGHLPATSSRDRRLIVGSTRRGSTVAVARFPTLPTRRSEGLWAAGSVVRIRWVVPGASRPVLRGWGRGVAARSLSAVPTAVRALRFPSAQPRLIHRFSETRFCDSCRLPLEPFCSTPEPLSSFDALSFRLRLDAGSCSALRGPDFGLAPRSALPSGTRPGPGWGEARGRALSWSARFWGTSYCVVRRLPFPACFGPTPRPAA